MEEDSKKLVSLEENLKRAQTEQHAKEKLADSLLTEAENKLKQAVKTGDKNDIALAQTLLETAKAKRDEERKSAKIANDMQKRVDKRKSTMLEQYNFIKKPKN